MKLIRNCGFLLILAGNPIFAQKSSIQHPRFELGFALNLSNANSSNLNINDLQNTFNGKSELLQQNLSSFQSYPFSSPYNVTTSGFQVSMMYQPLASHRQHQPFALRFGIGFNTLITESFYGYQQLPSSVLDTFTTNASQEIIIRRQIEDKNFAAHFRREYINLDLAMCFRSNTKRRFYFHTGLGVQYSINYSSRLQLYDNLIRHTALEDKDGQVNGWFYPGISDYKMEEIEDVLNQNFTYLYVPLGLNIRLSKKHHFFKHISVFTERQIGVRFGKGWQNSQQNVLMNQTQFGIKVRME